MIFWIRCDPFEASSKMVLKTSHSFAYLESRCPSAKPARSLREKHFAHAIPLPYFKVDPLIQ